MKAPVVVYITVINEGSTEFIGIDAYDSYDEVDASVLSNGYHGLGFCFQDLCVMMKECASRMIMKSKVYWAGFTGWNLIGSKLLNGLGQSVHVALVSNAGYN